MQTISNNMPARNFEQRGREIPVNLLGATLEPVTTLSLKTTRILKEP